VGDDEQEEWMARTAIEDSGQNPLMVRARRILAAVAFKAPHNGTVLWSGKANALRAEALVKAHPGRMANIQQLLRDFDHLDRGFLADVEAALLWLRQEPIWWMLSAELARNAEGEVWVFGSGRVLLGATEQVPRPSADGRSNYYSDSVFEKVELPELDNNPRVTRIWLMGKNIGDKPVRLDEGGHPAVSKIAN
jgi:hypothetical protein